MLFRHKIMTLKYRVATGGLVGFGFLCSIIMPHS